MKMDSIESRCAIGPEKYAVCGCACASFSPEILKVVVVKGLKNQFWLMNPKTVVRLVAVKSMTEPIWPLVPPQTQTAPGCVPCPACRLYMDAKRFKSLFLEGGKSTFWLLCWQRRQLQQGSQMGVKQPRVTNSPAGVVATLDLWPITNPPGICAPGYLLRRSVGNEPCIFTMD